MKNSLVITAAVLIIGAITPAVAASASDAAALYSSKCSICHGADGKGATAAGKALGIHDYHAPEVQTKDDSELQATIGKGKNKMPSFAGKLTDEQIQALATYVKELGKK